MKLLKKVTACSAAVLMTAAMFNIAPFGTSEKVFSSDGMSVSASTLRTFDSYTKQELSDLFDISGEVDNLLYKVNTQRKEIFQTAVVNGTRFSLTIKLGEWSGETPIESIVTASKLFFNTYPDMYQRFNTAETSTRVTLEMYNAEEGKVEVAGTAGDIVYLENSWLGNHENDFDCLTHEFTHVVQSGWNGNESPCDNEGAYMTERFADYCRYIYAYKDGYYNDSVWTLNNKFGESSYNKSVRFWVWLDYTFSYNGCDIMKRINELINSGQYSSTDWESGGSAWDVVFNGTQAAGSDLDTLWEQYADSDFSVCDSDSRFIGGISDLQSNYDLRNNIKSRNF